MGFRVVDKSCFTFATDLPAPSRNTHPSGVLHAFRDNDDREEHTFAWISNSLHIELAIKHFEKCGFDRSDGIVFIPYSTKRNWLDRYPHAAPALETDKDGEVVAFLNWRPYPNGLSEFDHEVDNDDTTNIDDQNDGRCVYAHSSSDDNGLDKMSSSSSLPSSSTTFQRLDLTPDQMTTIQKRLNNNKGTMKKQRRSHDNDDDSTSNNNIVDATMERNLVYLQERLDLTVEQLRMVVTGYPLVLSFELEANLIPTIDFYDDALLGDVAVVVGDVNNEDSGVQHRSRLASFICERPSLLEFNVDKRLIPRLEQTRAMIISSGEVHGLVDEEMLQMIATLTDSRFETWLKNNGNAQQHAGGNDTNHEQQHPTTRQKPNDPTSYVVVSNLQSGGNIGNIVRSASIFGCEECIVVGQKRYRLTGDHGSRFDLPRRHMWSHADAREYLHGKGVRIYGIEIMENAAPIMRYDRETGVVKFPFDREASGAAFIFGNEGQGLSTKQREICDEYLFIPQHRGGTRDGGGSASMNVACAAAVVLQAYCTWAGYSDASLEGEKFLAT